MQDKLQDKLKSTSNIGGAYPYSAYSMVFPAEWLL